MLHNWGDEDAGRILGCCRRAMVRGARLLLAERIVPIDNTPSEAALFDINMLVIVGGRERTRIPIHPEARDRGGEPSRA